jgi:hypothetical protein
MDEKLVKNLLDILPQYINFAIGFLRSPHKAMEPYERKGQVHSDLTSFLFAGVGAAYLLIVFVPIAGINIGEPRGAVDRFALWLTQQDPTLLPLEALIAILALVLVGHLIAKASDYWELFTSRWTRDEPELNFPGTAEDSVNAALGFSAVALPLTVAVFSLALRVANSQTASQFQPMTAVLVSAGFLTVFVLVAIYCYLVRAFAAAHNVSYRRAGAALSSVFLVISALFLLGSSG